MMAVFRGFDAPIRSILRVCLVVVAVIITAYLVYLLQRPITWLVIAAFLAIAVSGPIAVLARHMRKGFAIATVYGALVAFPIVLLVIFLPPLVGEVEELVNNLPEYAEDVTTFVNENDTLSKLNEDYDITGTIEEEAKKLPSKLGGATEALSDIGVGLVSSIFALVTILILSIFMVSSGAEWIEKFLAAQEPERAERMRRAFEHIAEAIGGYVGGALLQATIAGVGRFIVLTILGAPFAGALALIMAFGDLIPVVGATIAAFIVGVVLLFVNFPVAPDRLDHLRDRLPADRELRDPAAHPGPRRRGRADRDHRRRPVRVDSFRGDGRALGDPDSRLDPDRRSRVLDYRRAATWGVEQPPPASPLVQPEPG